ncbi:MAG: HD domain-containing protein [Dehalococcoidia bacterium]|nr:HD domain-containing protein [Dehalococcoidia bacterium]
MPEGFSKGAGAGTLRLAEVLAPLSLVTDMGMGSPDEHAMRACLLATSLARRAGCPEDTVRDVYYATLLRHLGCTATAAEEASHLGGDEIAARPLIGPADFERPSEVLGVLRSIGGGRPVRERAGIVAGTMAGFRWGPGVQRAVCEVASILAARLGLPEAVRIAMGQMFERWDGKGEPAHLSGERIALPARFAAVASRATAIADLGDVDAALDATRASSGGWLAPDVAACFVEHGRDLMAEIETLDVMLATVAAEPDPPLRISARGLDDACRAFGDMADLKSPYTVGHSSGVAALAEAAGRALGLAGDDLDDLRRAALLHDLGRVGVPAGTWEKQSRLTSADWEHIRLHAYYTERILQRSTVLARLATAAGMHHERIDGSGYHRRAAGRDLPLAARILAAADTYDAKTHDRPHRSALSREQAAALLTEEARAGRLDTGAVRAVLDAAGQPAGPAAVQRREYPSGLSEREVEVLRLVASGCSNADIAERLVISRRTAEHHVQHIYDKIGRSTRAAATMFAVEHDLLTTPTPPLPQRVQTGEMGDRCSETCVTPVGWVIGAPGGRPRRSGW